MQLYTIGHSNHPLDEFIRLLVEHRITNIVDVRSTPYSRFHPQYNKTALAQALLANGIAYTWAGEALGGRPKDPSCYKHHILPAKSADYIQEVSYHEVMLRTWFIEGIHNLLELASQQATCILCAEKDPSHCHRHHLIARYLMEKYPKMTVWHILGDGNLSDARTIPSPGESSEAAQISF